MKLQEVLCQYEYYVDIKKVSGGKVVSVLSKTALEARACGLSIIGYEQDLEEALLKLGLC